MTESTATSIEQVVPTFENLPKIVKNGLEIVAKDEHFESYEIECKAGANIGDGFMGLIMKMVIRGKKNGTDGVELTVLCKVQHISKARRELASSYRAFEREVLLYKKVLKEIEKLQHEKGITGSEGFFNFPKVYFADIDAEEEEAVIIMEDLRDRGFTLANKFKPLPIEHVEVVIRGLARLHAVSYCLKVEKPEVYEEFKGYKCILSDMMMVPHMIQMFQQHFTNAIKAFPENERLVNKITQLRDNLKDIFTVLSNDAHATEHAVVGHGDSWSNNFMFTVDEAAKAKDLVLIDWQMSRYATPILDLSYFIFISTDKELRTAHLGRLQKEYHDTLSAFLKELGHDSEKVYPYSEYKNHWKRFGVFGLVMSLAVVPFIVMPTEEIVAFDIDKMSEDFVKEGKDREMDQETKDRMEKLGLRVQDRIKDIITDMDDLGYI